MWCVPPCGVNVNMWELQRNGAYNTIVATIYIYFFCQFNTPHWSVSSWHPLSALLKTQQHPSLTHTFLCGTSSHKTAAPHPLGSSSPTRLTTIAATSLLQVHRVRTWLLQCPWAAWRGRFCYESRGEQLDLSSSCRNVTSSAHSSATGEDPLLHTGSSHLWGYRRCITPQIGSGLWSYGRAVHTYDKIPFSQRRKPISKQQQQRLLSRNETEKYIGYQITINNND